MPYLLASIAFILSLLFSWWSIPFLINWLKDKKILNYDMNKIGRPEVPGLGGLALVFSFLISLSLALLVKTVADLDQINLLVLLASTLSIAFVAFLGFVDDILMFPVRPIKPVLSFIASIPLIAITFQLGPELSTSFESWVGITFSLIIVPLLFIFSTNAINIMADFDGLVPGNTLIISIAMMIAAWFSGSTTAFFLLAALTGGAVAFYFFNRYPAKVHSGNIGTLFIGGVLGVAAIIGHLKIVFLILMIPYLIHFVLQERYIFVKNRLLARPRERGIPQEDGTLKSQYDKAYGLTHLLLLYGKHMTEKRLVQWLWLIEGLCALIALFVHLARIGVLF